MMDSAMHKIGLHGKALIPMILGLRLQRTSNSRMQNHGNQTGATACSFCYHICTLLSKNHCALLAWWALFVGIQWALLLYVVDIAIIFILGRIAMKVVPGKSTGLIMEMSSFKMPSLNVVPSKRGQEPNQ